MARAQLNGDGNGLDRAEHIRGSLLFVLIFRKLEVEVVEPQRDHQLQHDLGESLSEADADPAKERTECKGCSLATVRLLVPLAAWIEPIRHKLHGIAPLLWVPLKVRDIDNERVVFADLSATDSDIPRHLRDLADRSCRVEAK